MKIVLKADGETKEEDLIFSDEGYAVVGFIDIVIQDKEVSIHINDLLPVIVAFEEKYQRHLEQNVERE